MNSGDAGTFKLTATDDKGFVTSADPLQAAIPAAGSATLTVVLEPPGDAAPGTSDALTVRAESVGTPGLENFASLTSVVVREPASTTTIVSTTTTTVSSSTTTTFPCRTARCTIDAGLHGPECAGQVLPAAIRKKLDRATSLIDRAGNSPAKKARHLLGQAKRLLDLAGKAAGKAAKGRKPKLTKECAAEIQRATLTVGSGLQS